MTREEAINVLKEIIDESWIFSDIEKAPTIEACDMAISALSENKGDLISRQAIEEIKSEIPKIHELFDIAYEYNKEDFTRTELSQKCTTYLLDMWQTLGAIVDNYSPAENKGEWIPVSERLPEKNVWVLVTVEKSGKCFQEIMRRSNYFEAWIDDIDYYTDEIIAWQPLPEPYEEGGKE